MTTASFDDPTMPEQDRHLVYDVESIGLHGEGFAVGWVVVDVMSGTTLETGMYACPPGRASGRAKDRAWVDSNVPELDVSHRSPRAVRDAFWKKLTTYVRQGVDIWADHMWPVDSRFVSRCIDDEPSQRNWNGPNPLKDIQTLGESVGLPRPRRSSEELPVHHPLADAKHSARYLRQILDHIS